MALPSLAHPDTLPANLLFPDHYEASKRMIARDFAFFGAAIVLSVVLAAALNLAAAA